MSLGDVVDQLHDQDGLADTGAAKETDLTSLGVGGQQVDDLDAGKENKAISRSMPQQRKRWSTLTTQDSKAHSASGTKIIIKIS